MSNKYCGFCVVLSKDISESKMEFIQNLLLELSDVVNVEPIISDINHWCAYEKAKREIYTKIFDMFKDDYGIGEK